MTDMTTTEQAINSLEQTSTLTAQDLSGWKDLNLDYFSMCYIQNIVTVLDEVITFLEDGNTIPSRPICDFLREVQNPEFTIRIRPPDWILSDLDENAMVRWIKNVTNQRTLGSKCYTKTEKETTTLVDNEDLEKAILEILGTSDKPLGSLELYTKLLDRGFRMGSLSAPNLSIWVLVDEGKIKFNDKWCLELVNPAKNEEEDVAFAVYNRSEKVYSSRRSGGSKFELYEEELLHAQFYQSIEAVKHAISEVSARVNKSQLEVHKIALGLGVVEKTRATELFNKDLKMEAIETALEWLTSDYESQGATAEDVIDETVRILQKAQKDYLNGMNNEI